ncbi:hypothetical protein BLNAU_16854 [Blattamonas nauphoetae]|uniref:C3H1-type domain-containing protein n=1 Tax=Blattamonas nauphoetae TaxID=2049346 RepID=A0ABQ9XDE3_9EUKA|nr:hypothetical protein BLNAU_16854 [Blattamonas nauphoetae]
MPALTKDEERGGRGRTQTPRPKSQVPFADHNPPPIRKRRETNGDCEKKGQRCPFCHPHKQSGRRGRAMKTARDGDEWRRTPTLPRVERGSWQWSADVGQVDLAGGWDGRRAIDDDHRGEIDSDVASHLMTAKNHQREPFGEQ